MYCAVSGTADKLLVQKFTKEHNHLINKAILSLYPEQRRLKKDQRADVETKLKLGVKVSVLQKHVQNLTRANESFAQCSSIYATFGNRRKKRKRTLHRKAYSVTRSTF